LAGLAEVVGLDPKRDTPGWEAGKAFEYLVLRAFDSILASLLSEL